MVTAVSVPVERASESGVTMALFGFEQAPPAADGRFGFPEVIASAFCDVADECNCIIMSRAPGKAANRIINERYDLKSFFLKAKSCDWGPAAGFIGLRPEFSKKGYGQRTEQLEFLKGYLKTLCAMRAAEEGSLVDPVAHPDQDFDIDDLITNGLPYAAVPLVISNARRRELENEYLDQTFYDRQTGLGIACDAAGTVAFAFCFQDNPFPNPDDQTPLWQVCQGPMFVRAPGTNRWVPATVERWLDIPSDTVAAHPTTDLAAFEQKFVEKYYSPWPFPTQDPRGDIAFTPLYVCQNPWPPQTDETRTYRNAVTGDYDLFAVWPLSNDVELARAAERNWKPMAGQTPPNLRVLDPVGRLFQPVHDKVFTARSTRVPSFLVEYSPVPSELHDLESEEFGNINQLIADVCQTLNSRAAAGYVSKSGQDPMSPNVAFHSDEGGRPLVDSIDWPVAVFMPSAILEKLERLYEGEDCSAYRAFMFDKGAQANECFLRFLIEMSSFCYCTPVSNGWLYDLLVRRDNQGHIEPSDLAPAIVNFLLTGQYDEAAAVPAQLLSDLVLVVKPLEDPVPKGGPVPWPHRSAQLTYRNINAILGLPVPAAHAAGA
jgi:hypothetical protein